MSFLYHAHNSAFVHQVACECEFQKFENKSDAINPSSGIDGRLATMIKKWWFGEKLLVGKLEHKYIIEKELVSLIPAFSSFACTKYNSHHPSSDVSSAEYCLPL